MPDKVLIGDQAPAEPTPEPIPEPTPEPEPAEEKVFAGKFKSVEDLEKSYGELSKKIGDQGTRLGKAEEDRSLLLKQLDAMQAQSQQAPADQGKADDFEAQLGLISQQIEDGDLSIGEGMKQTALVSAQIAQNETVKGLKQESDQAAIAQSKQTFAEANPDFFELQEAGALEEVKATLPGFHDDISSYYALKAQQVQAESQTAIDAARAEGIEAGKAEMAKIAGGDSNTQKVLQGGGTGAEQIQRKASPMKPNEIRDSGMAALQKARSG